MSQGKETAMSNIAVENKEFKSNKKTEDKIEEILDFVADVICPIVIVGGSSYILGHLIGQTAGYKNGFSVGTVYGSTVAYSHVVDTLKALKQ
jgi:tetrahydromethanopterin S-methyltransferase subunit G